MFRFRFPMAGWVIVFTFLASLLVVSSALVVSGLAPWQRRPAARAPLSSGFRPGARRADAAGEEAEGEAIATPTAGEDTPVASAQGQRAAPAAPGPSQLQIRPNGLAPSGLQPNALGRIMILEYHQIGPTEDRWTRSYDNFRRDLERLYRGGYRPIGLNDYIQNHVDVPAGTTPVIFTFDDSSPGQFRYIPGPDAQPMVDPNSAVGIWIAFNKEHPDWRFRGTFFVLPGVVPEHRLFGQPEYASDKLRRLVEMGFELGNHTFYHVELSKLNQAQVYAEMGRAVQAIQEAVPGYQVNAAALPLGVHPRVLDWAVHGVYEGTEYHNLALLEDTGGAAYSPSSAKADFLHLPRIQATNMEWDFYRAFLDYFDQHPGERYVSAGDPDVLVFPASEAKDYRPGPKDQPLPDPAPGLKAVRVR